MKEETEWRIDAPDLAASLTAEFQRGRIVDASGRRSLIEETVAKVSGLKVAIFANEHPPPHFRVSCAGDTANFAIKDCEKLNGGLDRWLHTIQSWHKMNKQLLIETWNRTRPTNCPVGAYREDERV